MKFAICYGVGFALIVLQTTLFALVAPFKGFYDLLIPLMISIGIRWSLRESLLLALLLGLTADSVAGSPFGLYLSSYLWICFGVRQTKGLLEVNNFFILAVICVVCVLFENLVLMLFTLLFRAEHPFTPESLTAIGYQLAWVLVSGPPLFYLFNRIGRES